MINIFLFSFVSFFSLNAMGLLNSDEGSSGQTFVMSKISEPSRDLDIPKFFIDIYKSVDSNDEQLQNISNSLIKTLKSYLEKKCEDVLDYAMSSRILEAFEEEIRSIKNDHRQRTIFIDNLSKSSNWAEHVSNRTKSSFSL